jgi:sialic acid synthase SpsE/spore coat polysaccharide biosynthesis protein SpsF (cytidylyltransferase family)
LNLKTEEGIMTDSDIPIYAELANAHEGNVEKAVELLSDFAPLADIIKIQIFQPNELAVPSYPDYDVIKQCSLSKDEYGIVVSEADNYDIDIYADIFGSESLQIALDLGIDGIKIHSSDITNTNLLSQVGKTNKPVIISAGGSTLVELRRAVDTLEKSGASDISLMYGFQNYPTALADANLRRISALAREFDYPVGYASHAPGGESTSIRLPIWAIAAGAKALEIHVSSDRSTKHIDHYSALEPNEFASTVDAVSSIKPALGKHSVGMSQQEIDYRKEHKKELVATEQLNPGDELTADVISLKRSGSNAKGIINDPTIARDRKITDLIEKHETISMSQLESKVVATLACRSESTRLYGKPLQLVGEKPILEHQIDRLRRVESIDEIVLAISDSPSKKAFVDFAENQCLSYVTGSEEDVLYRLISAGRMANADIVVRSMTENPFIYWQQIDDLITTLKDNNLDLTCGFKLPLGAFVEVISLSALELSHQHGDNHHRSELCSQFILDNPHSFDIASLKPAEELCRPDIRLTVDNPDDLQLVREVSDRLSTEELLSLKNIVRCIDENNLNNINSSRPDGNTSLTKTNSYHVYGQPDDSRVTRL